MLDDQWRCTLVNHRVIEVTELTEAQLLGHSVFDLFPDVRGTHFETELLAVKQTRQPRRFELEYRCPPQILRHPQAADSEYS